jgi:hypothetical protein
MRRAIDVTPGVPGAGIAGLFYLASALLMPVLELVRARRGDTPRRRPAFIARQVLLAVCMLGGIWLIGWILGSLLTVRSIAAATPGMSLDPMRPQVIGRVTVILTVGTLVIVLTAVEILRLVVRRKR